MASISFESLRNKFDKLITNRPLAYRSFGYHSTKRVIYFAMGLIFFTGSMLQLIGTATYYIINKQLSEYFKEYNSNEELSQKLIDILFPYNIFVAILFFVLSITFFIMARLCRKIVNRNNYIEEIETTWEEMKLSSVNLTNESTETDNKNNTI